PGARSEPRRCRVAGRGRWAPARGGGDRARCLDCPGRHSVARGAAVRSWRERCPNVRGRRSPARTRLAGCELCPRTPGDEGRSDGGSEARMIQLTNVDKSVSQGNGRLFILRQISLDIAAGEFVSIMGPSGAGKSTLLAVLGMLDGNWTGEYRFLDHAVHQMKPKDRIALNKQHIGFVFQQYHLLDDLTVAERSEEHTSELQSRGHLVCRLLLEKKKR